MKHFSIYFLKLALVGIGAIILVASIFVLPETFKSWPIEFPTLANWKYPLTIGLAGTVLPFLFAIYQAFKLLRYIENNKAFTAQSVQSLLRIKCAALTIAAIYAIGLPLIYQVAQIEDAPGLIIIWSSLFIGIPFIIAVFSGVVQQLLQNVINIKSENDLTV